MSGTTGRATQANKHARAGNRKKTGKSRQSKSDRRADWQLNHALISATFLKLFKKKNRVPTQEEVARACKLHHDTVNKHMDGIELEKLLRPLRVLGQTVMASITARAIEEGDVPSAKLFFEKVWESGSTVDVRLTIDELRERSKSVNRKDREIKANPALSGRVKDGQA